MNRQQNMPPRLVYESRIRSAMSFCIMVALLTVVNLIILVCGGELYFTFALYTPYFFTVLAMEFGGVYIAFAVISAIASVALMAVFGFFGRRKPVFLIMAVVALVLDFGFYMVTVGMAGGNILFDLIFRALVIIYVILGIVSHFKLKKLADESEAPVGGYTAPVTPEPAFAPEEVKEEVKEEEITEESEPLFDHDGQGEIRLAFKHQGKKIAVYRKFGVTELVVDGKVYRLYERIIEEEYTLRCMVGGVIYAYNQSESGECELMADGAVVASSRVDV